MGRPHTAAASRLHDPKALCVSVWRPCLKTLYATINRRTHPAAAPASIFRHVPVVTLGVRLWMESDAVDGERVADRGEIAWRAAHTRLRLPCNEITGGMYIASGPPVLKWWWPFDWAADVVGAQSTLRAISVEQSYACGLRIRLQGCQVPAASFVRIRTHARSITEQTLQRSLERNSLQMIKNAWLRDSKKADVPGLQCRAAAQFRAVTDGRAHSQPAEPNRLLPL